jgi:intracellular multiplication protein IcmE
MSEAIDGAEKRGLARILADKKSRSILIGTGVLSGVVLGYVFLLRTPETAPPSRVIAAPEIPSVPGTAPVSPAYLERQAEADRRASEEARLRGGSALPTPVAQSQTTRLPTSLSLAEEQPRDAPPERPQRNAAAADVPPPPPVVTRQVVPQPVAQGAPQRQAQPQVDAQLMNAMTAQMRQMMGAPAAPTTVFYTQPTQGEGRGGNETVAGGARQSALQAANAPREAAFNAALARQTQAGAGSVGGDNTSRFTPPNPGTILYARLVGRVNSDVPGPVIGEILQGPFTGARLLGNFRFSERGVILQFSSMAVPYREEGEDKSETVPIGAVAVDTQHLGTAMATDIDRHIVERVALAFGTAFMTGVGRAIGQGGATVTQGFGTRETTYPRLDTTQQLWVGAGEAANAVGRVAESIWGNRRTTITVDAGTPFGLLFLGPQGLSSMTNN